MSGMVAEFREVRQKHARTQREMAIVRGFANQRRRVEMCKELCLYLLISCLNVAVANAQEEHLGREVSGRLTKDEKESRWVNIFPVDAQVYSLVVDPRDPNSIYASTYRGVFKSMDVEQSWVPFWIRRSDVGKSIIRFDPVSVDTIYIGTSTGKLGRSRDAGKTWEDITGVLEGVIQDIVIHPTAPDTIYVASTQGLFKTLNAAKTWGKILDNDVSQVFLNPASPQEVYANHRLGFVGSGLYLYLSKDGGQNFERITPKSVVVPVEGPLRRGTREMEVQGVGFASLDPHDPARLFASAFVGIQGGTSAIFVLMRSIDKGQSWQTQMHEERVEALVFHPNKKDVIYILENGKIRKWLGDENKWKDLPTPYAREIADIAALTSGERRLDLFVNDIAVEVLPVVKPNS